MKICVIGNSHVGALKRAWDKLSPANPTREMVFFAHRVDGMAALKVEGNQLVPTSESLEAAMKFTSGGLDHILPKDYDVFLIYGLRANPNFDSGDRFISRQVRQQAVDDLTQNKLSLKILKMVRQLTDARIFLGHNPLSSASALVPNTSTEAYESGIAVLNELFYGPMGAEMLVQPLRTIVNGRNTDAAFSQDSQRLAISDSKGEDRHPKGEDRHMNQAFGEIWLGEFFARLESPGATLPVHRDSSRRDKPGRSPTQAEPSSPWRRVLKRTGFH
jgi:hypothetical protein